MVSGTRITLLALIFLCCGCSHEFADFCSSGQPDPYQQAIAALSPWKDAIPYERMKEREIASVGDTIVKSVTLPTENRDQWMEWAETQLAQAERALDWVELHREEFPAETQLRSDLSNLSNELVGFHGYCQQGRVGRMIATLQRLDRYRARIRASSCLMSSRAEPATRVTTASR